jgi:hypothetical protein
MAVATKNKTLGHAEYARRAQIALVVEAAQRATGLVFNADGGRPLADEAIQQGWTIEQTLDEVSKAEELLDLDDHGEGDDDE